AKEVREALAAIADAPQARGQVELPPPPAGEGRGEGPHVSAAPTYRRTFVGREVELRQLEAAFDAAQSGQGSLAAVVGEPGIGKTALCEQLSTYVAVRGGKT